VIAGKGDIRRCVKGTLPGNIELRNRQIQDDEAVDLFHRCSLVVLPYVDATQSALIAAAYFFGKPVIVTRARRSGYVIHGDRLSASREISGAGRMPAGRVRNPTRLADIRRSAGACPGSARP
jgi:glycosyltransferase involved in cell wall biosynthesis